MTIFSVILFSLASRSIISKAFDFPIKENINNDKVWTIKFNKEITFDESVKKQISVTDSKGNLLPLLISLGSDGKSLIVTPDNAKYSYGEEYKLTISDNIYDKNKIKLKESSSLRFKVKQATSDVSKYLDAAKQNILAGDFKQVIENATKVLESDTNNVDAYIYRAYASARLYTSIESGFEDINKAIELSPNNLIAYSVRGYLYYRNHDSTKSTVDLNKGILSNPSSSAEYLIRALANMTLKNYDESLKDLNAILEANPDSADAYSGRGAAYLILKEYQKAINDFDKSTSIRPSYYDYYYKSIAHFTLKSYDEAISSITSAIEQADVGDISDEDLSISYLRRGEYYINVGEFDIAIEDLQTALELDPNNTDARDHLTYMLGN